MYINIYIYIHTYIYICIYIYIYTLEFNDVLDKQKILKIHLFRRKYFAFI